MGTVQQRTLGPACGTWEINYDLPEDDIAFKVFIDGDEAVTVDRRSGQASGFFGEEYGVPEKGEFFLDLAHGPRITVEDFVDYSARGSSTYACPSSSQWVGEVTLTDPSGDVHVLGNGGSPSAQCSSPGPASSSETDPTQDIFSCAELDIQGQELPSICGPWEWSYDFNSPERLSSCDDEDLGFKIKVDGDIVVEVNSGSGFNNWEAEQEDQRTALTGGGSFIAGDPACQPSAQPSGQPLSTERK
jgi:hypothetical protein